MQTPVAQSTPTHKLSPQARSNLATWRAMEARRTGAPDLDLIEFEARVERMLWLATLAEVSR